MLFSINLFAVFVAVAAVGVSGSPAGVDKRVDSKVLICSGKEWSGTCQNFDPVARCKRIPSDFNGSIGSFGPPIGFTCALYT